MVVVQALTVHIDGNGWSGRYQALLASGAAVLKATIFPEWNSDWLIPYYHYIVSGRSYFRYSSLTLG